jgi:hypothetical protein
MEIERIVKMFKREAALSLVVMLGVPSTPAIASAGWYPTVKGEVIHTQVCLPKNIESPVYLQLMGDKEFGKTVVTIHFKKLPADSYCRNTLLHGLNPKGAFYDLKFDWKVNVEGSYGLQFYSPKESKAFYGWPDGITTTGK